MSRRILPFFGALVLLVLFEILVEYPRIVWWWLPIAGIAPVIISLSITNFRLRYQGWWHALFTPLLLTFSSAGLLLFLNSHWSRQLAIFMVSGLSALMWDSMWRFYWNREHYHEEALENTSLAVNTAVVWFTSAFFLHLLVDSTILPVSYNAWLLPVATTTLLIVLFLIDYKSIRMQRYDAGQAWLLLITQSILIAELFWVINFLPHRVEVKSFLVVLAYYLLTGLGRAHLDGTLRKQILRRYTYVACVSLLFVFLTATWIL